MILSSERFFRFLSPETAECMIDWFSPISDTKPRVLGYVRDPVSYYVSKLQQSLKTGRGIPIVETKSSRIRQIKSYKTQLDIDVEVRAFERSSLINQDVISDFFHWVGLEGLKP